MICNVYFKNNKSSFKTWDDLVSDTILNAGRNSKICDGTDPEVN